ncbi:leucine-rich repeat and IQ domain-containing protein 3 [Protopterus annectens]|uniref:leucine-rich repeat and IQ domain-containing protein 3 n=1 Tax=Protopterus annectens TaxID=7888 RepID=UPI001CF95C45|nr:leucine-rich repeat and IQ domain-containing protein 3 [Protopterus annectens]
MKQLYETSYLTPLSEKLILEHGQSAKQDQEKELSNLVCTKLDGLLLKNVTYLSYCRSLKICSLSNNFLTTIDALAYCPHLVKLDLHSNQIVQLPGEYFWAGLKNLHLLYLHDNSITDLENVHSLSTCTNLLGLTMYDTPVSLQKIYRHCTVNSIWSLKALDKYIISDEEIIEDWHLPGIFKAFNHRLRVNILPAKNTVTSLQDEIKSMNHIISKINQILAHTSPVLIIQRWIRGHMTRKRLGMIPFMTKVHHRDWLPNKKKYSYGRSTPSLKDYWSSVLTAKQELTMHDKKHKTAVQDVQDTRYFLDESVRSKRENKHEQMQQKKHEETRKQIILADKQTANSEIFGNRQTHAVYLERLREAVVFYKNILGNNMDLQKLLLDLSSDKDDIAAFGIGNDTTASERKLKKFSRDISDYDKGQPFKNVRHVRFQEGQNAKKQVSKSKRKRPRSILKGHSNNTESTDLETSSGTDTDTQSTMDSPTPKRKNYVSPLGNTGEQGDTAHLQHEGFKYHASNFTPPMHPAVNLFLRSVLSELHFKHNYERPMPNNITDGEKSCLEELANNKDLVIINADKGGAVVVLDWCAYDIEAHRQLNDVKYYTKMPLDPTLVFKKDIDDFLNSAVENGIIDKKTCYHLTINDPTRQHIYFLPKIHKDLSHPPGRPIVSGMGSITEPLSEFLTMHSKPLLLYVRSRIQDTTQFLSIINDMKLDTEWLLCTLDVSSLYTNIPHWGGLDAIEFWLNESKLYQPGFNTLLLNLTEHVLTKNVFFYNQDCYLQIRDYSGPTEEEEKIQFRLSGYRICICESSPVRNMLLHRKESGNDIRFAIQHFHSMNLEFSKPCKPYLPPMTLEKRLFTKLYGSLSLTPFETVEKAYKERQRSETMARKKDWVKQIHSAKEEAKNHILGFLEEKKNISLRKKEDDSRMILGNIEQCKSSRSQFIKESKEKNAKFLQWKRKKTAEHLLAQNFNCHNSSVGKALLKHHLLVKRGDARQGAIQLVKACRELQEENKDQVKECLEKRKLMLQAENSAEKDELHSYIWEETNQRLLLARKRVAMLKTLRTTKEPMLPVPVDQRSNEGAYLMQSCEANDL